MAGPTKHPVRGTLLICCVIVLLIATAALVKRLGASALAMSVAPTSSSAPIELRGTLAEEQGP